VVFKIDNSKTYELFMYKWVEYHIAMNRSKAVGMLNEAFEKYMCWETY
jgi:hypothetical protein